MAKQRHCKNCRYSRRLDQKLRCIEPSNSKTIDDNNGKTKVYPVCSELGEYCSAHRYKYKDGGHDPEVDGNVKEIDLYPEDTAERANNRPEEPAPKAIHNAADLDPIVIPPDYNKIIEVMAMSTRLIELGVDLKVIDGILRTFFFPKVVRYEDNGRAKKRRIRYLKICRHFCKVQRSLKI